MKYALLVVGACSLLACGLFGCQEPAPSSPSVGTNSNWLRACEAQVDCTMELTACTCGACTVTCTTDEDCDALADARCVMGADPAAVAACRDDGVASGICLPHCTPGSCDPGQACIAQACVLADLPDVAFCAAAVDRDSGIRQREEALLALLQTLRSEGGVSCGGAAATPPAPALRFDARLLCAARVWAEDLAVTRAPGMTDSAGRSTTDRMAQAGYAPRLWGDSYAVAADTPAEALELMLSDADSCRRLMDPAFVDVGVGGADDVLVVTIGAE